MPQPQTAKDNTTVVVYQYGIRHRHNSVNWKVPESVTNPLRLAHTMRNNLVELEHQRQEKLREVWSDRPEIKEIEDAIGATTTTLEELAKQAKRERSADRTVAARRETATKIRETRQQLRGLKQQRRAAISEAATTTKPARELIATTYREDIKTIRRTYAARGLYWGTYNEVIANHTTATTAIARARAKGMPANLKFHRWDGTGTLHIQLQRGAGAPPRTPQLLASGQGPWRNVFQLSPWIPPNEFDRLPRGKRRRTGRGFVRMRISADTIIELPVQVHRMLPADADVCEVGLTISRIAERLVATINVTAKIPQPAPAQGPKVALHLGWRRRGDGSVRVGTWACPTPLGDPPPHLAGVVVAHDGGRWGEIVFPTRDYDRAGHPARLRSIRDQALNPVQDKVAAWLDTHPQPGTDDRPGLSGDAVRRWRSPGRFAALAQRWRDTPPEGDGGAEIASLLEGWRKQDKHLWTWEGHERHQLTGMRNDLWRKAAAWLTDHAGTLVVDDTDLRQVRRGPDVAEDDPTLPGVVQHQARARAALTAPGVLREKATVAAGRRGVVVVSVGSQFLSRTCPLCRVVGEADARYAAAAVVQCSACGGSYDQDRSAAGLMLVRASELEGGAG